MKEILDLLQRVADDLDIQHAMAELGVSRRTLYNMLADGRLASTGSGRARRIDRNSIEMVRAEAARSK